MDDYRNYLNIVDIIVAAMLLFGFVGGIRRGLSGELLRILSIIIAIVVGWKGTDAGSAWLSEKSEWPVEDVKKFAFLGLIVATYVFLAFVRVGLRLFLSFSFKGKLEVIGGALIGLLRAAVFSAVALLAMTMIDYQTLNDALANSVTGKLVKEHVRPLYDEIARENPDLNLPTGEPVEETTEEEPAESPLETPAFENYLGPLIDSENEQP